MNWSRRSYTKTQFTDAWMSSKNLSSVARKLGLQPSGNRKSLEIAAKDLKLSSDHFYSEYYTKDSNKTIPLKDILVENSSYSSSSYLRIRLIEAGIFNPTCSAPFCPSKGTQVNPWTGEESDSPRLSLDHINGIRSDNRISNLRILCYYCHSHTPTFCGTKPKKKYYCTDCGCSVSDSRSSRCLKCNSKEVSSKSKFSNYTTDEIIQGVESYGYLAFSKMIGVSDNGIRKHLRREGINPLPKKRV